MDDARITLGDYSAAWLKRISAAAERDGDAALLNPRTVAHYVRHFKMRWTPRLGHLRLRDLARRDIRAVLLELQEEGVGAAALRLCYFALCSCLSAAVDDDVIPSTPAYRAARGIIRKPRPREGQRRSMPREVLVEFLRAVPRFDPRRADLFDLLAGTGMRIGEALGLEPWHVDPARRVIVVRQQWINRRVHGTKNGEHREVEISEGLAGRLARRIAHQQGDRWLFPRRPGGRWPERPDAVQEAMKLVLAAAGLPSYTPHSLRHARAVLLFEETGDLQYVQRQLGHSSILVTSDLYGRDAIPRHPRAVGRIDRLIHPDADDGRRRASQPLLAGARPVADRQRQRGNSSRR